jgi:hypothetical protein
MKRKNVIAVISIFVYLVVFSLPQFSKAQDSTGYLSTITRKNPAELSIKPKIEINGEPIPIVQISAELVEIRPGETRQLFSNSNERFYNTPGHRAGVTLTWYLGKKAGGPLTLGLTIAQLDRKGVTLDIDIRNDSNNVLVTRKLSLRNYEEGMIEFASADNGDKRLAVRFMPTITAIPPVLEFPVSLRSLTLSGLMIRNGDELVLRTAIVSSSNDDPRDDKRSFFPFSSDRLGFLVMSYRPFPGAVVAGYFEDRKLVFEWNGDTYEWLSLDKSFMPEGKWAAYFWQAAPAGPTFTKGMSIGVFESDPNKIKETIGSMIEMNEAMSQHDKQQRAMEIKFNSDGTVSSKAK